MALYSVTGYLVKLKVAYLVDEFAGWETVIRLSRDTLMKVMACNPLLLGEGLDVPR